jgi:UDP-3-O-[3-hydroxymyristoyl] N-acetylglucosamine deacetylase
MTADFQTTDGGFSWGKVASEQRLDLKDLQAIAPAVQERNAALSAGQQHTLKTGFECSGIGLHTGVSTCVRVLPAEVDRGRYFVRLDLAASDDSAEIPARIQAVKQTTLSTELAQGAARVRTVEHLLAALVGLGIDNARIELDGPEVPILDGSAQVWVEAITQVGWMAQSMPRSIHCLNQSVLVQQGDAFAIALPASETRFTYGVDYDLPAIGRQWCTFQLAEFVQEVAPARTFGFAAQVEQLRASGLIKGGSLENALVCASEGWLNPPLRFADEPVRHKLLDLIGDLSLLGTLPQAHILAYKASHTLHTQLAQRLAQT